MKRMTALLLMCVFALLFIVSFLLDADNKYRQVLNVAGQAGLAASILLFFVLPAKKAPPKASR